MNRTSRACCLLLRCDWAAVIILAVAATVLTPPTQAERRDFKSTQEQWKVVVDFLEVHPSLLKKRFSHFDGGNNEFKRLWDGLTLKLNSMGLGARSTEKWQLAISTWKSKTKSKATQLRLKMEKTGGGPIKSAPLNPIEERLIALMGWKSVTGDRNVELELVSSVPALARATTEPVPSPSRARTLSPPTLSEVGNTPPPLTPPLTPLKKSRRQSPRFASPQAYKEALQILRGLFDSPLREAVEWSLSLKCIERHN